MKTVIVTRTIKLEDTKGNPNKPYPTFRAGNVYELPDDVADQLLNPAPYAELVGVAKASTAKPVSEKKAKKVEAVEEEKEEVLE